MPALWPWWVVVTTVFFLSSVQSRAVVRELVSDGSLRDIVLTPSAADPRCFSAIVVTSTGSEYRVTTATVAPWSSALNAAGCVAALQSPNQATRYLAWTRLHTKQGEAEEALLKLWQSSEPRARARALHLLARMPGNERKYVEAALEESNADLRITGLRIARELKLDIIPYVKKLAGDSSAQVRRECAIALRHQASPEAPTLWAALAQQHDGTDRWYLEALGIGADGQENAFFNAWMAAVGRDI